MTKCQHCDADILSPSQPNRMGTTPKMQKMYDEFGGEETVREALVLAREWMEALTKSYSKKYGQAEYVAALAKIDAVLAQPASPLRERDLDIPITIDYYAPLTLREIIVAYFMADNQQYEGLGKRHADRYLAALVAQPASLLRGRELEMLAALQAAEVAHQALDNRANFKSYQALDDRATKLRRAALSTTPPEEDTFLQALQAAKQAIEYSLEMGGTDPAGVLLQALNKCKSALSASPTEQPAADPVTARGAGIERALVLLVRLQTIGDAEVYRLASEAHRMLTLPTAPKETKA